METEKEKKRKKENLWVNVNQYLNSTGYYYYYNFHT